MKNELFQRIWIVSALALACTSLHAQEPATASKTIQFKGAVSVTNNGFSFIPSFTLDKPAAIVNLSVSGPKRFSFEPEFRYALEGKPWSFIFIWRYKIIKTQRFQLTAGTHLPALNFRTVSVVKNNVTQDLTQTLRFFPVLELAPTLRTGKHSSLGLFYLYGHGAEPDVVQNTHFLSLRANFTHITLHKKLYLRFFPQVFYLKSDQNDGLYAAGNLGLGIDGFPLSVTTMASKVINSTVPGKDLNWNVNLVYSFGRDLTLQKPPVSK